MTDSAADTANAGQVWGDEDQNQNTDTQAAADVAKAGIPGDDDAKKLQKEKTDLGRKVKDLTDSNATLKEQNAQILEKIASLELGLTGNKQAPVTSGDELFDRLNNVIPCPVDPDDILTPRLQAKYDDWKLKATQELTRREYKGYADNYVSTINSLKERGGDLHEEVIRLVTSDNSPYNRTHGTGRGDLDAKLNYANALADLRSNDPNAVKWGRGDSPTKLKSGVNIKTDSDTAGGNTPKLNGAANDLAKHFGYTDKEIKEAQGRHIAAIGKR